MQKIVTVEVEINRNLKGTIIQIIYNNKYMITSTQITNTEVFAFVAVLIFKLMSRKVLFIIRRDNRKFHWKKTVNL